MKLRSIQASNFEGQNFEMNLADITAIIGSNYRGKTTRLNAIRFLLLGYLPELGKQNRATFALSSGREMTVRGIFDTGEQISRTLTLDGDSVKATSDIPDELKGAPLAVMLDPMEYFNLSDRDRVTYVAKNIPDNADGTLFVTRLGELYTKHPILSKMPKINIDTPSGWFDQAIGIIANEEKQAKSFAKRMEETTRGIAALKTLEGPGEVIDAELLGEQRHALANSMMEAQGRQMKLVNKLEAQEKVAARRDLLANNVRLSADAAKQLSMYNTKRAEFEGDLAALGEVDDLSAVALQLDAARNLLNACLQQIAGAEQSILVARKNADELVLKNTCPYCGAAGDSWRDLRADELRKEIDSHLACIEQAKAAASTHRENLRVANENYSAAKAKRDKAIKIRGDIKNVDALVRSRESIAAQVPAWEAELNTLPPVDTTLGEQIAVANKAVETKKSELGAMDAKMNTVHARAQDQKRLAESEGQRDQAKADQLAAAAALEDLRKVQGEMVEAAFKPLLEMANAIFGGVLLTPLAYFQGDIGTWRGGVFVQHATFSGTEKALCYAAIQAALTQNSPVKIMLIDELARVDDDNLDKLLVCVQLAIAQGGIHQFIGIDTGRPIHYQLCQGAVTVIELRP